jgi:hypothetical protein
MRHDELCRAQHMQVATYLEDIGGCDCPIIAAARADERATTKYEVGVLQWEGLRLRQERADLRAKVDALPSMFADDESGGLVILSDVLALIDGGSE